MRIAILAGVLLAGCPSPAPRPHPSSEIAKPAKTAAVQAPAPPAVAPTPPPVASSSKPAPVPHGTALALLLDASGSMAGPSIAAEKEGAKRVVSLLGPNDLVEVLTFAASTKVVMPLTAASERAAIDSAIDGITTSSGTAFYTAIDLAHADLLACDALLKHVLLVTDGKAVDTGLDTAVTAMFKDHIGFSAIGLGSEVDGALLGKLAKLGGGRFHAVGLVSALGATMHREIGIVLGP